MGCDIHPYVERKIEGVWHSVTIVNGTGKERDYEFFTHLCGVRQGYDHDNPTEWPEPKGLPEDVSVIVGGFSDLDGCDGHSHSYETFTEFIEKKLVLQRLRDADNTLGGTSAYWAAYKIIGYEPSEDENLDDFRVVFWFDN